MKETKMTELLGLRKGEGRTVFYLMSYLTLQCFGTSLGIAIGTSMLLAQVGADKLPYIFVGISFAALCFSSIYPVLMARRGSQYICRLYMIIGFLVILICNFMIRADLYLAGINLGIFLQYLAFFVLLGWDIMHFGNYCQTVLNPLQRKRLYGLILSATKLGGILGGICLGPLIQSMGQINVLILWALAYLASGFVLIIFEKEVQFKESLTSRRKQSTNLGIWHNLKTGYREVLSNTFLIFFATLIALDICTGSLMVFQFNEGLGQIFAGEGEKLSTFLGQFAAISNGIALILQIFLAPRLTSWLGVGWVNLFYPCFSVLILGFSLARWDLVIVTVLMFHKDYLTSVIHFPNRILFYNAVAPERRTFILGFLEGTWTHCVNLLFGITLILVVQLGPKVTNLFSDGFSQIFSVLGLILFVAYFFVALKLKLHYQDQLLSVVKHEDLLSNINNFKLNKEEIHQIETKLQESGLDYLDFIPTDTGNYLEKLYHKATNQQKWTIFLTHPIAFKKYHEGLDRTSLWNLFQDSYPEKISIEFAKTMTGDQILSVFERNLKNKKVVKAALYYCIVYEREDVIIQIMEKLEDFPKTLLPEIADITHYFKLSLNENSCAHLLKYAFQLNPEDQIRLLNGVSYSSHKSMIPRLAMFYGIPSRLVRNQAIQISLKIAKNQKFRDQFQNLFFSKDWSYSSRLSWFNLFVEFPLSERAILLAKILEIEKLRLVSLTQLQVNLENSENLATEFLASVKEEIQNQCNYLLIYFRSEFDKDSLEIVRKALFEKHSERKYEAIELLSSTGKVEICDLLIPFLEVDQGDHRLKALHQIEDLNIVRCDIKTSIKECLLGTDEWLRACALEWIAKHKQSDYLETVKSLPELKDLISSEMILHCLNELQSN